jgi:glucosamine--fructose-6-phosphate aminotransferase (isomerizing)
MCGIIACVGRSPAQPVLLGGLRRLEYRGYDGAGIATADGRGIHLRKCAGGVRALEDLLEGLPAPGTRGIGHTRWATHGPADSANAHPHEGGDGLVAVAHNGVIDNHLELRRGLEAAGFSFQSQTDTEAVAHLVASLFDGDLPQAVSRALPRLRGSYALAVLAARGPEVVVGARLGSPLVLGVGEGGHFLASDPAALAGLAEQVACLQDGQLAVLSPHDWQVLGPDGRPVDVTFHRLDAQAHSVGKGGFAHHMLAEIHEQPAVVAEALSGRLEGDRGTACLEGLGLGRLGLWSARRLLLTGCGTSHHAALLGEYLIESLARLPWRSIMPASCATATHPWTAPACWWPCPSRARRPTPWPPCAPARPAGWPPWRCATWRPAAWRARPTAASPCGRGRRSAWPAPRRSRPRSSC